MGIEAWHRAIDVGRNVAGHLPVSATETVDEALDSVVLFARDDARAGTLEPVTDAARSLLDGPGGDRARAMLDGITSWVDARPGGQLSTIAISGADGRARALQGLYLLAIEEPPSPWTTMQYFMDGPISTRLARNEHGYMREPGGVMLSILGAGDMIDLLRGSHDAIVPRLRRLDSIMGHRVDAWNNGVAILREPSGMRARERRWDQVHTLLHELEHATSHMDVESMVALRPLEEGTADLHAHWPGAVESFAQHLGIGHEVSRPARQDIVGYGGLLDDLDDYRHPYASWSDGMRGYVELAGIDPTDPAQLSASRDLLRGVALVELPERIARRVLAERGIDDPATIELFADVVRRNEPGIGAEVLRRVRT